MQARLTRSHAAMIQWQGMAWEGVLCDWHYDPADNWGYSEWVSRSTTKDQDFMLRQCTAVHNASCRAWQHPHPVSVPTLLHHVVVSLPHATGFTSGLDGDFRWNGVQVGWGADRTSFTGAGGRCRGAPAASWPQAAEHTRMLLPHRAATPWLWCGTFSTSCMVGLKEWLWPCFREQRRGAAPALHCVKGLPLTPLPPFTPSATLSPHQRLATVSRHGDTF